MQRTIRSDERQIREPYPAVELARRAAVEHCARSRRLRLKRKRRARGVHRTDLRGGGKLGVVLRRRAQAAYERYGAFAAAARAGGRAGRRARSSTATSGATTVRIRNEQTLVTDGPYAEVKEALGGYLLLDCARSTKRSTGPRRSLAPSTAPSRSGRSTSTRRSDVMKYALLVYGDQAAWEEL